MKRSKMGPNLALKMLVLLFYLIPSSQGVLRRKMGGAGPSPAFAAHQKVRVSLYDGKSGRVLKETRPVGVEQHHLTHVSLVLSPEGGRNLTLDLILNKDLLPDSYFEKSHKEGKYVTKRYPSSKHVELCHYHGKVLDEDDRPNAGSWAAISTCNGELHGVFNDGSEVYHLEHAAGDKQHYLYLHNDHEEESNRVKRSVSGEKNRRLLYSNELKQERQGHSEAEAKVKGPWNANQQSRYVELLLVVDNQEYRDHGSDLDRVHRICKDVANVMNALYSPLNIYIALVGVIVWTEYDEIALSTNGDTTLTNFLHYRRERLVKDHPNDNAQLLTGIQFDGGVVGKALKGPMCTFEFSGGVNMWHSDVIGLVATTVAHEMGHNFGMEHDSDDCECPDDRCIMAPASSTLKPSFWSSCSLEYLALAFEHGMDYCLRNRPEKLFESPVCGNGFVEEGEECDCGLKNHCDNPCCNPETCTMYTNATCATGECCDFETCQPKSSGAICRHSTHNCDLPEYCTGQDEFCPKDVFKVDGTPCKVGQAYCYQGSCRTHSDQCKLLWGPSGKKSDNQCYEQNKKGSRHGNCGYNRLNTSYIGCEEDNVRCGMLHCSHLNERLEFGMESVSILSHSFINSGGTIIPCRTALVDLGLNDVDPGLAPEGARCGDGKLCVNQKCISVASLQIGPNSCPQDCNGNGICNSRGHCHCEVGYAPPFCLNPGTGGSVDSGPASTPEGSSALLILLYICLIVIPIMFLICLFVYVRTRGEEERGDWRLLLKEKAPPCVRGSKTTGSPAKKRPRSVLDISGPLEAGSGSSGSQGPSPTHALLPHVDTNTTGLNVAGEAEPEVEVKGSASGGFFAGLSRSKRRKQSMNDAESSEEKKEKSSFMQNLARSITFPSAIGGKSKDPAKYEIKVEAQQPKSSIEDVASPVGSGSSSSTVDEKDFVTPPSSEPANSPIQQLPLSEIRSTMTPIDEVKPTKPPAPPIPADKPIVNANNEGKNQRNSVTSPLNNPKLAFPHSSSFTAGLVTRSPFLTASSSFSSPSPASSGPSKGQSSQPQPSKAANNNASSVSVPTSALAKKPTTVIATTGSGGATTTTLLTSKPVQSPFLRKTATATPTTSLSTFKPKDKPEVKAEVKPEIKAEVKAAVKEAPKEPEEKTEPQMTKTSTLPLNLKGLGAEGAMPKSATLPVGMTAPGASPQTSQGVTKRLAISKPVFQTATPAAQSLISKAPSTGISQSSILAKEEKRQNRTSKGVVFCDPITLPSPTNPNNPPIIHQPTLALPSSCASPKPSPTTSVASNVSLITPTWSKGPLSSDAVICHIDAPEGGEAVPVTLTSSGKPAPIASPDETDQFPAGLPPSGSSGKSSFSKIKSKLGSSKSKDKEKDKDNVSDNSVRSASLRGLEISGPVLQNTVDLKTKLVPVCNSEPISSKQTSPTRTFASSPTPKRTAPPPPIAPRGVHKASPDLGKKTAPTNPVQRSMSAASASSSKRPASIATSRPMRPTAPPPRPPPERPPPKPDMITNTAKQVKEKEPKTAAAPSVVPRPESAYSKIKASTPDKDAKPSTSSSKVSRPSSIGLSSEGSQDTPTSSPLFSKKKSPDSVSMASSDGDLMKEILGEMLTKEDDSIYSTLTRKKNKNKPRPT